MKSVYDVRMLLKKFGTFIYTNDRVGDLILMGSELEDLYEWKFITQNEYMVGKLILQREKRLYEAKKRGS